MLHLLFILALASDVHAQACPPIPVSTCIGLNASKCPLSYYNPGASQYYVRYPCILSGSTCVASSSQCARYCPGSTYVYASCAGLSTSICESYYTSTAYLFKECNYIASTNKCGQTTPAQTCIPYSASTCTGALVSTGCSSLTTQASCTGRFQTGAHGGSALCSWTAGVGCYANQPCK